jgi:uncharacterized membrane protein
MTKGDKISNRRIEMAVKGFIEAELALLMPTKSTEFKIGNTTTFFKYQSLRKRLTNKLKSKKNGTFILKSEEDLKITLLIGKAETETIVITIERQDLCFKSI